MNHGNIKSSFCNNMTNLRRNIIQRLNSSDSRRITTNHYPAADQELITDIDIDNNNKNIRLDYDDIIDEFNSASRQAYTSIRQ